MKKLCLSVAVVLFLVSPFFGRFLHSAPEPKPEPHRSPVDVAVVPGASRALTANQASDSASLVDLTTGTVLAEVPCGRRPSGVACSADGRRAAVSNLWSATITLLEVRGDTLLRGGEMPAGDQPRSLAFALDGNSLYAALGGAGEVVQIDWRTRKALRRWSAPGEPRRLALSRDGRFLAAAGARSGRVWCWDTRGGGQVWERRIMGAFNLHGLTFSADGKELVAAHIHDRQRAINLRNIEEGWAIDNRLTRLTLQPDRHAEYWQLALDTRGKAVGDPCAVAFNARGDTLAVAAAGTHELLLFRAGAIPWSAGSDPGDLLNPVLDLGDGKFRRVPVGCRPAAVQFVDDGDLVVVANHLLDAVQVVDTRAGKVTRTIPLGNPARPSLARQGEAIFYDAARSHHQWFSCHTCHADGHTCGRTFDTLNDDSYGNPKLTPTLRGVSRTGPWTWHGWQTDLGKAVEKSLTDTLFGPRPSANDVRALEAFLDTLDHPPNPHHNPDGALSEAAERGKALFHGKARCARCHHGDHYTSTKNHDVKIEPDNSDYDLWNPPSLRGAYDRGPYFHDGRADTLEEVLQFHHAPERLGGAALTPQERSELVEFLKAL